ncbi:transposase [Streptomyces sp. NPDC004230]
MEYIDVGPLAADLRRAQQQWAHHARAVVSAGGAPPEVFAMARAVVCGWWEQETFWEREAAWGPRLEQVVAVTSRRWPQLARWGVRQWRLLARDAVVFPEVAAVAGALADPRLQQLAAGRSTEGLLRDRRASERLTTELGRRLRLPWLEEVEATRPGPLSAWAQAVARTRRRPADYLPGQQERGMWWVRSVHRPVEVGPGLRDLATDESSADSADSNVTQPVEPTRGWQQELVVPRRVGHSRGLQRRHDRLFNEGLQQARAHVAQYGHLTLAHTAGRAREGFDLGRWLANRRAEAASLTVEQAAELQRLDAWWNPPWPIDWQRAWYRARTYVDKRGAVHGGDNLAGLPNWLQRWLRHQITHYPHLHEAQQQLLAELGLTRAEVKRFHSWHGRRRPAAEGLAKARTYVSRHGHLAVSRPTTIDGFALGTWLNAQRHRQRSLGRPTRLGRQLTALDPRWNPPWPVSWQRMWWAARYHHIGLPEGVKWWPGAPTTEHADAWLRQQDATRARLHPEQQRLIDELVSLVNELPVWQPQISDAAWQTLSGLLPARLHTGGRPRCERQLLEAIVYVARTGQAWRCLPEALGPFLACRRRFLRWREDGTLMRVCNAALPEQDTRWQQSLAAYLGYGTAVELSV